MRLWEVIHTRFAWLASSLNFSVLRVLISEEKCVNQFEGEIKGDKTPMVMRGYTIYRSMKFFCSVVHE